MSATTLAAAAPKRYPWSGKWVYIALCVGALFLIDFAGLASEWRNSGLPWPLRYPFVWQLTGHLAFLTVLPVLLRLFANWPLRRENLRRRLPWYLVAMVGITLLQILLMWLGRIAMYALLGWGPYDYGAPRYILPMELMRALPAYLGTLGIYSLFAALQRQREREVAAIRLEHELLAARLGLLKAQLQPHFLFNALNMIRTYVHEDAKVADQMVGHLADFLRMTLRHAAVQEVTLSAELQFLESYLAIMKARFEDRLSVKLSIAEEALPALIPHLLLQPLVENALHYALQEYGQPARIEIAAARDGDRLTLWIADNGPGTRALRTGGHGIGLANTRERLQTLYGSSQRLDAGGRTGGGFQVHIELPWHLPAPATSSG